MDRDDAFIRRVQLSEPLTADEQRAYPWRIPVMMTAISEGVDLHPQVTFLVGENGSGKSTLLESIAVAAGLNPEGGSSNFAFSTRDSHSEAAERLRLIRGVRHPRTDFFLRAESLFTAASYLERLPTIPGNRFPLEAYGGRSLHEQSHGESFLAVLINRFGPHGLYFLDEPEAALSPQNCLSALRRIDELVRQGSQFVIATHSPILLAYPGAMIYECSSDGLRRIEFDEADPVVLTRAFLQAPQRFVAEVLG